MRLTIDLTPMLLRSAGVKNHLYYWTRAMLAGRGANQVELFPFLRSLDALNHEAGVRGIPDWRLFVVAGLHFRATRGLVQWGIPKAEIFHGSPQMRRRPRCARMTSHIHDLTCWLMPELHTAVNVRGARELAEHVWKRADGLIAVSESAKQDAVRVLGLNPDRICVIHHGVPEAYFEAKAVEAGRRKYALVLGTIEPRKNIDRLLDAWVALPKDVREEHELVIAGPAGWKSEATLARLKGFAGGVQYVGYVAEEELPRLTAGASALLYPSLYEGFGFPLAQAMAAGVPTVTSNVSSLPEVAAGSALLVDPFSASEIRDAILRLLTSPGLQVELGQRGREIASGRYRWEIAARKAWEFFGDVRGREEHGAAAAMARERRRFW
jgi:glycosyltransferase involved in cell wall biosynthesis